ncbi:hypothetical protein HRbin22_00504 [Candidatus Thermoflexus japonica]|uniref:Uncharacterized protein n=1 Tax=Candidatus Thermoflexus japonica TaxID=2035417 RepID=A0A2H5Y493_9CHLR|nr:hypothetical protein HRbin22_00504 [Candidatus Thermoflexus japonica]
MDGMTRRRPPLSRAAGLAGFALMAVGILAGLLCLLPVMSPPSLLILQGSEGEILLRRVGPAQWRLEARSARDRAFAEGVLDGLDAAPLLILRRAAAYGQLEALIGPEAGEADRWARERIAPAVARAWEALDEETRAQLEAYAAGVNTAWRMGIPGARRLPRPDPLARPWDARDSLAVAAGLALAHPGWMEAEIRILLQPLSPSLRSALEDPRWSSVPRPPDVPMREAAWRAWAAAGAAPELGLFRGCREGPGFRLHAMAAPVLPLPWRAEWVEEALRLRWPGIPGALARIPPSGGWWLQPAPGVGDPLDHLEELVRGILTEGASSAFWSWAAAPGDWPSCWAARATHREALQMLPPQDWLQRRVHGMLRRWEEDLAAKSPSALVYVVWREEVLRAALEDELGEEGLRRLLTRRPAEAVLTALLTEGGAGWGHWDAPERETQESILREAYRRALIWIGRRYGDLHTIWEWGKAHAAVLSIPGWPFHAEIPVGGDEQSLWPTPIDPARPYRTAFWPALTVRSGSRVEIETAPGPWWWPWP